MSGMLQKLLLKRFVREAEYTLGVLFVDGAFECFVLEDHFRPEPEPKVMHRTCIPCGTYEIEVTHSPKFGRDLPLLLSVPGFTGIRIHPGNTAEDTSGCLLPGLTAAVRPEFGDATIERSLRAFDRLFAKLPRKGASIEVVNV